MQGATDAWEWPTMYYTATVILRMTPVQFWKTTPRTLNALFAEHLDIRGGKKPDDPFDEMM